MRIEDLKRQASGRWHEVYAAFGLELHGTAHVRCPFPEHLDVHPSFRFTPADGRFYCSCGCGDAIEFVQRMTGSSVAAAVEQIVDSLWLIPGEDDRERAKIDTLRDEEEERLQTIDQWHNDFCRWIGERRATNGPKPPLDAPRAEQWAWLEAEAAIQTDEAFGDAAHEERGDRYIRAADRFPVVRKLCKVLSSEHNHNKNHNNQEKNDGK